MKKVTLILGAAFTTSIMMSSFVVSSQTFLNYTNDTEVTLEMLKRECNAGNMSSCSSLADRYKQGVSVSKDLAQASKLYKTACDGGHLPSCNWNEEPTPVTFNTTSPSIVRTYNPVPHFGELGRFVGVQLVGEIKAVEFFTNEDGSVLGMNQIRPNGERHELWRLTMTSKYGEFATSALINNFQAERKRTALLQTDGSLKLLYRFYGNRQYVYRVAGNEVYEEEAGILKHGLGNIRQDIYKPYTLEAHQAAHATLLARVEENSKNEREREEQRRAERAAGWESANKALQEISAGLQAPSPSNPVLSQNPTGAEVATADGKSLRFVLMIGMTNLPGDQVNCMCYSNVITRPAPPGWGGKASLPPGSYEQAIKNVESLKQQFIAECEKSGRKITHVGNFSYVWNQFEDGEQRISNAHAKSHEDISVKLQ